MTNGNDLIRRGDAEDAVINWLLDGSDLRAPYQVVEAIPAIRAILTAPPADVVEVDDDTGARDATDTEETMIAEIVSLRARLAKMEAEKDQMKKTISDLKQQIESAFCDGFAEGFDGTWIEGDYTPAWKKSRYYGK